MRAVHASHASGGFLGANATCGYEQRHAALSTNYVLRKLRAAVWTLGDPNDGHGGEWWLQLAEQRLALGDVDGAATAYKAGIDLGHPEWPAVERGIAVAQGNGATLLERFQKAAVTDRELPGELVELLSGMGRSEQAIAYVDEALRSTSTSSATRNLLLYALAEDALSHRRAADALSRLEGVAGASEQLKFLRARALCELGRFDEAETLLAPFEAQGVRAPVKFRLLLAICRARRADSVDETLFSEVKPLPDWVTRLRNSPNPEDPPP